MKTISILQNSAEWDELRAKKIGASDASIIMGVSEFMTPYQLWMQKTGKTKKQENENFIQRKGHKKEIKARAKFELLTGLDWNPVVCIHSDYEFLMASLDGYNEEVGENLEIKFFGKEDFENLKNKIVPKKYYPQIQMQMAVTGSEICHLLGINEEDKTFCLDVRIDPIYIQNELYPKIFDFQEKITKGEPPELTERDLVDLSNNSELKDLLDEYSTISDSKKAYEEKESELKKKIFDMVKAPFNVCNGIKITIGKKVEKKIVDFEKIVEDFKVDVSKYTSIKIENGTKKITFPKVEKEEAITPPQEDKKDNDMNAETKSEKKAPVKKAAPKKAPAAKKPTKKPVTKAKK